MAGMCIIFAWYGIIYILMPHLSTFVTSLLSHLLQPSVCCGEVVCAGQGRAGLRGGLKWPRLPLSSQSNLAASYLPSIHPSTHPSVRPSVRPPLPVLPALPVCLLQPLTLLKSQASMAVAQRAARVPSGAQERLRRGRDSGQQ